MAKNVFGLISDRIGRTVMVALAGQVFFIVSVMTMIPLRMAENPVVNYNLFYLPLLAVIFTAFLYRACAEEKESRSYLYGYFAALVAWPLLGEVASMPVDEGIVKQYSSMNIKLLGGYIYVIAGWVMLKIMWRTKAVKGGVLVFFMVFLGIWSFELYMDNYSSNIAIAMMPKIAGWCAAVGGLVSIVLLICSWRTTSIEKKTVLGCVLYLTMSIVMMGSGPWKTPSDFYVKYEAAHIDHEILELQEEKKYMEYLTQYMLENELIKPEDLKKKKKHDGGEDAH